MAESAKKLGLNPDLSQIDSLAVKQAAEAGARASDEEFTPAPGSTDETFGAERKDTDINRAKCAIATIESGSCGGNYGTVGPPTRTGARAYGKYQVMDFNIPSWTSQACGQAMNTEQFRADGDCQEKVFEKVYGGYVSSCGSYEAAASKWFSGRCNITNSNDGYLSVPGYVGKFAKIFGSDNMPFGAAGAPYTGGGSPFANVNPFNSSGYQDQVVCTGTGYCYLSNYGSSYPGPVSTGYPVSTGAPVSTGNPVSTGPVAQPTIPNPVMPTGTGVGTIPVPVTPVAVLLVQPKTIRKGGTASVSWSSVGMSGDLPCQLFSGTSFIAQGNGGSRNFDTAAISASSTVTFTLQCFSLSNTRVQKTATLLVE